MEDHTVIQKTARWRWLAMLAVFALVAAACQSGTEDTTTTAPPADGGDTTTTTAATPTTEPSAEAFTYRTGIFQDTTTDNYWAYLDPASTVWNQYALGATHGALYGINYPGIELDYDLAASADFPLPEADGDGFSVTVEMRQDATWSDGTPITAEDVVFTAETVRDLGLGGNWVSSFQWAPEDGSTLGLTAVEAVDTYTVKFTWNQSPGLAVWPHGPGLGPIMPKHFWESAVEEAAASDDPAAALYAVSGADEPSGGTTIFDSREEGAFTQVVANADYYDKGREITSGGVTFTVGPFISEMILSLYGDQSAAVLALKAGEVDYLFNPLGMQRGLQDQVVGDENLSAVVNPTNGFRYLAFNLRRDPTARQGFRDAMAFMIDKEFMANSVLQGVAFPLYATVPEGNTKWYNEEVASEIASQYVGLSMEERLAAAVEALKADGFAWEVEPLFENNAIVPGQGITLDGEPVPELEILSPGPGYDPLRATYSVWIEQWLTQLGFDATAFPTDFNTLVQKVFVPDENGDLDYDMFLLGWSLGSAALPTYHESFWAGKNDTLVNDGNNNTGFNDPDFNALVEEFNAATTEEAAFEIMWEMERILAEKKPYVLLFDTGILEFYRSAAIDYPFTESLSGIQFLGGMPGTVQAAR